MKVHVFSTFSTIKYCVISGRCTTNFLVTHILLFFQLLDDMRSSVHSIEKQAALSRRPISAFPAFETLVVDRSKG